jgi:hypothetical protein
MVYGLFSSPKLPRESVDSGGSKGVRNHGTELDAHKLMGDSKPERSEIFFMTVMVAQESGTSASRTLYNVREAASGSRILLFDRHHPSVPTCAQPEPSRAAAVKGGPSSGPPRQRRVAPLTAASTAATLGRVGDRSTPIRPSKSAHESPSKAEITLMSHTKSVATTG